MIAQDQRGEGMWQRKHHMEVWNWEEFGLAVGYPLRCGETLALGTVPIAARVVGVALEAALRTLLHVPAKLRRATGGDGLQNPLLAGGDWIGLPIAVAIKPDDVGHFPAG